MTTQNEQGHILIADDDDGVRVMLHDLLEGEGYAVSEAKNGTEVLTGMANGTNYDLVLMDVRMPGIDGMEVLERLHQKGNDTGVIVITAYGTSTVAIKAMQMGAFDYLLKPFEIDDVLLTVQRFFEHRDMASRIKTLEQSPAEDSRDRMVGQGPAMQRIYKMIGRIAASDTTVLVTGETGTGKELIATVLHANSVRRAGPLVRVNCAALPDTLLESELFGHEKGAFTSAMAQRKGRFELANGGSIFLDEVGELSPTAQKKLLRVLQEGEFERVGGTATIKVNVRVITATNRNLEEEVRKGNFREDLFYRLNVINIHMPPLRERKEDIPLLVEHFLNKYRYSASSAPNKISEESLNSLLEYEWPGNVRQLENEMQRAVTLSQGKVITSESLSLAPGRPVLELDLAEMVRTKMPLAKVVRDVERIMLSEALRQSDGDHVEAAERLQVEMPVLERKLREFGLG